GVHAGEIVVADLPIVGARLRLTILNELRVVDDDVLYNFLILVPEHAEAAEVRFVGRNRVTREPGAVGELVEVRARRAGRIEVGAVERATALSDGRRGPDGGGDNQRRKMTRGDTSRHESGTGEWAGGSFQCIA